MEAHSLIEKINSKFPKFTSTQKNIARFILDNPEEAAFLSAQELAERTDSSEASVIRFAVGLEYGGYFELRKSIQELIRRKLSPARKVKERISKLKKDTGVLEQVIMSEIEYLKESIDTINPGVFENAVNLIAKARKVFIIGIGSSSFIAELFEFRLRRLGKDVASITSGSKDIFEKLISVSRDDVVVVYGFSSAPKEIYIAIDYAKRCQCKTILISDSVAAPMIGNADICFIPRRGPLGMFRSLVVPMVISDSIVLALAMKNDTYMKPLDKLEEVRNLYNFWKYERVMSNNIKNRGDVK